MRSKKKFRPVHLWSFAFALWALFLSGVMGDFVGSPGVVQAQRLKSLLDHKQSQVHGLEAEIARIDSGRYKMEKSSYAQLREIRRVLGYAAPDEIIFDFTSAEEVQQLGARGR